MMRLGGSSNCVLLVMSLGHLGISVVRARLAILRYFLIVSLRRRERWSRHEERRSTMMSMLAL